MTLDFSSSFNTPSQATNAAWGTGASLDGFKLAQDGIQLADSFQIKPPDSGWGSYSNFFNTGTQFNPSTFSNTSSTSPWGGIAGKFVEGLGTGVGNLAGQWLNNSQIPTFPGMTADGAAGLMAAQGGKAMYDWAFAQNSQFPISQLYKDMARKDLYQSRLDARKIAPADADLKNYELNNTYANDRLDFANNLGYGKPYAGMPYIDKSTLNNNPLMPSLFGKS
jgi:hypothetical protein